MATDPPRRASASAPALRAIRTHERPAPPLRAPHALPAPHLLPCIRLRAAASSFLLDPPICMHERPAPPRLAVHDQRRSRDLWRRRLAPPIYAQHAAALPRCASFPASPRRRALPPRHHRAPVQRGRRTGVPQDRPTSSRGSSPAPHLFHHRAPPLPRTCSHDLIHPLA
ncbi:hypothetical protein ACP70R_033425 [Stipagrostis hirtigluma subsp. patula]